MNRLVLWLSAKLDTIQGLVGIFLLLLFVVLACGGCAAPSAGGMTKQMRDEEMLRRPCPYGTVKMIEKRGDTITQVGCVRWSKL